jgi:hypothetical protein
MSGKIYSEVLRECDPLKPRIATTVTTVRTNMEIK